MSTQSIKKKQVSWQTMQGLSAFWFFVSRPDIESIFTLIGISMVLIGFGISPLYIKDKSVSVYIVATIMVALGAGIGGLIIGELLERLFAETPTDIADSWVAGTTLICSSLGILAWIFIVLKISPITRPPLIAITLFAIAGVYSLIYGVLSVKTVLLDDTQITSAWGEGIAFIFNGCAMIVWTHLVTRKMSIENSKIFVICLMIAGVATVLVGIAGVLDAIF
ncbi:hypothetical protein J5I95_14335 [Candidatus Poribacteria bacterium]|nr:hypothetical protein [Candidatus Poribacteria bacterium]